MSAMGGAHHNPSASLYQGRLAPTGRARSSTGRLLRTSSEQMLDRMLVDHHRRITGAPPPGGEPEEQIDYFLHRYGALRQRYRSLDRVGAMRNSFSSQSLAGAIPSSAGSYRQRRLEALGIPL